MTSYQEGVREGCGYKEEVWAPFFISNFNECCTGYINSGRQGQIIFS